MTTKWLKTFETQLTRSTYLFTNGGFESPNPVVMSGDGTVYYVSMGEDGYGTALLRNKYENNAWTNETFIGTPASFIIGTKQLPNSTYTYPVATTHDGNTLVLIKNGFAANSLARKILITSYSNGQLVPLTEITFIKQSNYNSTSNANYYIQKVFMSSDGLKIVILTHGGINTLVFSNGTWNLLPSSADILPRYFPFAQWGEIGSTSYVSKNGMYLTLGSLVENCAFVFKFDTQLNNWVLFKTISGEYIIQTFVSNTGVVLILNGWGRLYRYEYSLTTNKYELIVISYEGNPWDSTRAFVSDDCNTYFCRIRSGTNPIQVLRMLKWKNGNWEIVQFPTNIVPYITNDQGTFGSALGISSDGITPISTSPFTTDKSIINVFYNIPLPTLHLGDMVKIKETDVSFNEANVFVKDPTVALNVANKQYVDVADEEVHALILASATTDTTSNTEYYDLLGQRQTVQTTLAVQIDQLYQYFFNASRANATLFYTILTSPLALDGCSLWLDSADSSSVIRSGTSVSAWNDKSSRGYTFTQTNSAKQPVYTPNALDGKSTIGFLGQFLSGASGFELGRNSLAMFVVCGIESWNAYIISKYGYPNPNDGNIRFSLGGGNTVVWAKHYNPGLNESVMGNGMLSGYVILELVVKRVEGKDITYFNGTIPQTNTNVWNSSIKTYAPDISYNITNPFNMILGGRCDYDESNNAVADFEGKIAEVVAYLNPYDFTDSKRYQIEGYLAHKWGLESKLPNSHPFKTATSIRL